MNSTPPEQNDLSNTRRLMVGGDDCLKDANPCRYLVQVLLYLCVAAHSTSRPTQFHYKVVSRADEFTCHISKSHMIRNEVVRRYCPKAEGL